MKWSEREERRKRKNVKERNEKRKQIKKGGKEGGPDKGRKEGRKRRNICQRVERRGEKREGKRTLLTSLKLWLGRYVNGCIFNVSPYYNWWTWRVGGNYILLGLHISKWSLSKHTLFLYSLFFLEGFFFSTFSYDTIFFFKWSKSNSHPTSLNYHSRFLSWNLYYDNSLNNHIFVWIALFQKKKDIVYKQMTISDIWKFFDNQWFFYFHLTNFIYTYIYILFIYTYK